MHARTRTHERKHGFYLLLTLLHAQQRRFVLRFSAREWVDASVGSRPTLQDRHTTQDDNICAGGC